MAERWDSRAAGALGAALGSAVVAFALYCVCEHFKMDFGRTIATVFILDAARTSWKDSGKAK